MANVADLIARYLAWCADNRARKTLLYYRAGLKQFAAEFGKREFSTLTQIEIEDHLSRVGKTLSNSTRRRNVVSFTGLQNWALVRALIDKPVTKKLEKPPAEFRARIPTRDETAAILRGGSRAFRRIYRALRISGARPGELCRARIDDLKNGRTVIVMTEHKTARKTGKPRRIQVGKKLRRMIGRAIGGRTEGPIFLSPHGKQWTVDNLSGTYRKIRDKAGLEKDLVLYLARHEFGTRATEKHGIHAACVMLGHTQITTTQRYAHADEEKLREQQDDVL